MTTIAVPGIDAEDRSLIAPWWHTALLVTFFLALAASGALFQSRSIPQPGGAEGHPHVAPLYLSLIAGEWGLFLYVWKGLRRQGAISIRDLTGGKWTTWLDVLRDALLALVVWGGWGSVMLAWDRVFGAGNAVTISAFLPRRPEEILLWVALSLSAGVCEEVVFRGYLQKQFEALTRSRRLALIMQAGLFGVSHGYQGTMACARIALFGVVFGALALWRKTLRPGIILHAWTDISSGLFGI
jgi:membrane protease YdiL (CAAX protease family)